MFSCVYAVCVCPVCVCPVCVMYVFFLWLLWTLKSKIYIFWGWDISHPLNISLLPYIGGPIKRVNNPDTRASSDLSDILEEVDTPKSRVFYSPFVSQHKSYNNNGNGNNNVNGNNNGGGGNGGGGNGNGGSSVSGDYEICFWCLSGKVAFRSLQSESRSILLTSGTLSPLNSFTSELGLDPLPVCLEAGHVVNLKDQVFATSLSSSRGVPLLCNYKSQSSFAYQVFN